MIRLLHTFRVWYFTLKKILIVDDEFLIRYSLSHMLQTASADVTAVASGREALQELSSLEFDLCCLDIHLPDINGIELMKQIKGRTPRTRVIMMTGGVLTKDMISDIHKNAVLLLSKPFDLFKVKTFVDHLLAEGGSAPASAFPPLDCGLRSDQRRHERRRVAGTLSYSVLEPGGPQAATVLDISEDGMCLETASPLIAGRMISIANGSPEQCACTVRWSIKSESDASYRAGIQFVSPVGRPYFPAGLAPHDHEAV